MRMQRVRGGDARGTGTGANLPDVIAAHGEEGAGVVELDAADGTARGGGDGVEVLRLAQVPQFDGRVRGAGGHVEPVLREGQARDCALVRIERRHHGP